MEETTILSRLELPARSAALAWDGEGLWASLSGDARLARIDPSSGSEDRSLPLPASGPCVGLAWASEKGARGEEAALWLAMSEPGTVVEIAPEGGEEQRRLTPCADGWSLSGLCTDGAAGPSLWFLETRGEGQDAEARAGRFDARDGEVHKRIVVPGDVTGLAWDGRWLWTAQPVHERLLRVDPMFADITARLEVSCSPRGVAHDGEALWVASENTEILRLRPPA